MLDLNSETLTLFPHGIIVIFRSKLNGFWDLYHGTNVGLGFRPGTEWKMHFLVHWRWLFVYSAPRATGSKQSQVLQAVESSTALSARNADTCSDHY